MAINLFNSNDTSSIPFAFSDVTNPESQNNFGEYGEGRSFYDVMGLGEYENPIETAAFQIQIAGSMDPEALAATEGMLTPYGPGLPVSEIEGIAEEYIGITSGINLNNGMELFKEADVLYNNPVFGKAYNTVVETAENSGLDMNNLQTSIDVLQNAGQAIGYKTPPSGVYQPDAFFDLFGSDVIPYRSDPADPLSGGSFADDSEATVFFETIANEAADKFKKQSLLNNYIETAGIQINTPAGVLPETMANIRELEEEMQGINATEMLAN